MKVLPIAAAFALSISPISQAAAQTFADRVAEVDERLNEGFRIPYDDPGAAEAMDAVGKQAEALLADAPDDLDESTRLDLLKIIGQAYFGAAQVHDSDFDSEEDLVDRAWLIKAVDALRPVMAARHDNMASPAYDFRGAAGQMWHHARYYDLPDKIERSAEYVQGNRYMFARSPENKFEREFLAASLYVHGWLTKDDALIAEADTIYDSFPEGEQPYELIKKREAIAEGRAPYAPAGEIFW